MPSSGQRLAGKLGRYVLKHEVATGGMATVYLAQLEGARGFDRWFAIKVIHRHLARDRRFVDMFLDEARVTARLHHPNVCSIIEFGEEGAPHIVMEYLHGETLAAVIRHGWKKKDLPLWLGSRIVADAARGLHAAHDLVDDEGNPILLVHRDVSPQNIMVLYDGVSKVLDFGVARARGRLTQTQSHEVKGKIAYMAPEQLHGQPIDRRSDIWALGVVLWESTVGARLFRGETDGETTLNVIHKEIPKPSRFHPNYPKALEAAVMAALERDPAKRIATAAELADLIDGALYAMGKPTGSAQVAVWMGNMFGDRKRQREQLLRSDAASLPANFEFEAPSQESLGPAPVETSGTRMAQTGLTPVGVTAKQDLRGQDPLEERLAGGGRRKKGLALGALGGLLVLGAAYWIFSPATPPDVSKEPSDGAPGPILAPGTAEVMPPGTLPGGEGASGAPTEGPEAARGGETPASVGGTEAKPPEGPTVTGEKAMAPETGATSPPNRRRKPRPGSVKTVPVKETTKAPEPVAEPAPPAPTGPGKLNVLVLADEGGEIFVDGKRLGEGILRGHELPSGPHTVTIRSASGKQLSRRVEIKPGEVTKISIPNYD